MNQMELELFRLERSFSHVDGGRDGRKSDLQTSQWFYAPFL